MNMWIITRFEFLINRI